MGRVSSLSLSRVVLTGVCATLFVLLLAGVAVAGETFMITPLGSGRGRCRFR